MYHTLRRFFYEFEYKQQNYENAMKRGQTTARDAYDYYTDNPKSYRKFKKTLTKYTKIGKPSPTMFQQAGSISTTISKSDKRRG